MNNNNSQLNIEQVTHLIDSPTEQKQGKTGAVRRNRYIGCNNEQLVMWLDPRGMIPKDHFVWFVNDAVDSMDLSGFISGSGGTDPRGCDGYDPAMLLKLMVYCKATGRHSSRKMERTAKEEIPCRLLMAGRTPDHDTIANFESNNREAIGLLYEQTLKMASEAGLIELDVVAVDGTKKKANASKHKAMSYGRMKKKMAELNKDIRNIGKTLKQRQLPDTKKAKLLEDLEFKTNRLNRIKENKLALEQRVALEKANKTKYPKTQRPSSRPKAKTQINFTDRESRIMRKGKSFEQAYNAQIAVDKKGQIIVAQAVTQEGNDKQQLVPMGLAIKGNMGQLPNRLLADSGYFSAEAVSAPELLDTELFVPPGKAESDSEQPQAVGRIPKTASPATRMKRRLKTTAGKAMYGIRKGLVEPVFGQIQNCMGFTGFSVRGLEKTKQEWSLVCALHNLLKIYRSGYKPKFSPA